MAGFWLVKQEPTKYPFEQLLRDKKTTWDGVRNHQARNNLQAMKKGDQVLYYHSNVGQEVVGLCEVAKEAFPDPTADDPRWLAVTLVPKKSFARPVTLADIKADPSWEKWKEFGAVAGPTGSSRYIEALYNGLGKK